uniref:Uncharacterized protein n=1 Tax=Tanacetum cinerariifolium TaxID=118510 RepID=A0A699TTQ0_TANCI|nr:hypothetical protein [Tanacetum cinerariifolium]
MGRGRQASSNGQLSKRTVDVQVASKALARACEGIKLLRRRFADNEGKDLPLWHHLVCGDRDQVHKERISQSGRMLSEKNVAEDDWEDYLIFRAG